MMFGSSYFSREYTDNQQIQAHKQNINNFFAQKCFDLYMPGDEFLIVDSFEERTRKTLLNYVSSNDITTVDYECQQPDELHQRIRLSDYLRETCKTFRFCWADIICSPRNCLNEIKDLFARKLLRNNGILAITICMRGTTPIEFGAFKRNILRLQENHGYILTPIPVPHNLVIKTHKPTTFNLNNNMTDNGAIGKTGRTLTLFYHVTLA